MAELPFILMHPKPEEEASSIGIGSPSHRGNKETGDVPVDTNLIELDA